MPKRVILSTAVGNPDGTITVISEDDTFADDHQIFDHPSVKAHPEWFVDLADDPNIQTRFTPPSKAAKVEQATAAPGETRDVKKPRKFGTVTDS
jgi:hypothetical protein